MWSAGREIAVGDVAIVWMTRENLLPIVVTPGKELNNKFGYYRHEDFVGVPYGSKVGSRNKKGFIHLLRPTPELWTLSLPHRTQILYIADIAFITSWLNIRSGSRVVEAGTGSGSFSHSTARAIGSQGHLYSYEFHEARAAAAKEEFQRHGMTNVTLTHRNVCKDGFTIKGTADAVFLDLPAPWDAIDYAKEALRKDCVTRICCFSPCMEQVLRTVSKLNEAGFADITMYETLLRPHDVSIPPPLVPIGAVSARLKEVERRREEKRLLQIANAQAKNAETAALKRKRDAEGAEVSAMENQDDPPTREVDAEEKVIKRTRTTDPADADGGYEGEMGGDLDLRLPSGSQALQADTATLVGPTTKPTVTQSTKVKAKGKFKAESDGSVVSKAFAEVRGHTSYLTFACLVPGALRTEENGRARQETLSTSSLEMSSI